MHVGCEFLFWYTLLTTGLATDPLTLAGQKWEICHLAGNTQTSKQAIN
jgi:hypothetical protein